MSPGMGIKGCSTVYIPRSQPPSQRLSPKAWRKQPEPLVTGQRVLAPRPALPLPHPLFPGWSREVILDLGFLRSWEGLGLRCLSCLLPSFSPQPSGPALGLPASSRKPPVTASLLCHKRGEVTQSGFHSESTGRCPASWIAPLLNPAHQHQPARRVSREEQPQITP